MAKALAARRDRTISTRVSASGHRCAARRTMDILMSLRCRSCARQSRPLPDRPAAGTDGWSWKTGRRCATRGQHLDGSRGTGHVVFHDQVLLATRRPRVTRSTGCENVLPDGTVRILPQVKRSNKPPERPPAGASHFCGGGTPTLRARSGLADGRPESWNFNPGSVGSTGAASDIHPFPHVNRTHEQRRMFAQRDPGIGKG